MYQLLRRFLFLFSPEWVHYFSMNSLKLLCSLGFRKLIRNMYTPSGDQHKELFNICFSNPVGLGAGFDKNARYLRELECLGFGFVEIGTVTPLPQAGNDKPRLFRLPQDKALINRMGFNNDGVELVAQRLKKWKERQLAVHRLQAAQSQLPTDHCQLVIGGNIGKNKSTPNEDAWKDYEICFNRLYPWVDYFVVNVSSPNTPGLRALQEKESLRKILVHLQDLRQSMEHAHGYKPLLLKIAPDLTNEQLDDVAALAMEIQLDGLVAANTTISRDNLHTPSSVTEKIGAGGLSGKPVAARSTAVVKYLSEKTGRHIPVIASGGIFTAADATEKLEAGASLVQVWTGFIYEGPAIVKRICKGINQ